MLRLAPLRWMSLGAALLVVSAGAWMLLRGRELQRARDERAHFDARAREARAGAARQRRRAPPVAPAFTPLALRVDPSIDPRSTHVAWFQTWLDAQHAPAPAHFKWDETLLQLVDADTPELGLDGDAAGLRVEIAIDTTDPAAPRASARVLEWTPSNECWTSNESWWEVHRGEIALSAPLAGDANGWLVRYEIEGRRKLAGAVRLVR